MWTIRDLCILVLVIQGILVPHSRGEQVRAGDSRNKRDVVDEDYDKDFEFLDDDITAPKVQHESPFSRDNDVVEMTTSHCTTLDRTRVCDCGFTNQDLTVPIFSGNMLRVTIRNCKRVIVRANTFANIYNIAHLDFENVEDLVLHSNALSFPINDWGHVSIWMHNVRMDFIPAHTFNGFIQGITFQKSSIGAVERFAANGIRSTLQRLQFLHTSLANMEPYAFKKFTVELLEIDNLTTSTPIPSKFFYGIEVRGPMYIKDSNLSMVHSSAFDMTDVDSFSMTGNHIEVLNGEAFRMALLNGATVEGNRITECHAAAFRALRTQDNYWRHHNLPMPFRLHSNALATMDSIVPLILYDQFATSINNLTYLNSLFCTDLNRLENDDFFTRHSDTVFFRMAGQLHTLTHISNHYCESRSWFWYYVLIGGALLFILLLVLLIVLCVWYRRRRAQQLNLIMPDGRTYRETTIVMQIENHNLLKTDL